MALALQTKMFLAELGLEGLVALVPGYYEKIGPGAQVFLEILRPHHLSIEICKGHY